ncbi:MAG: VTC domain-containing protein [Desulfobacula sp.]|jgi:hypothetical protein|nr:VTC domain-containing protein [Desulfobacula sp.]
MSIAVPEDARCEIKFVAHESEADYLRQWLHLHWAGFKVPYPDRWVNNVYFDTLHYFAYQENLSGASARTKVRYRWYEQHDYPDKGTLEVKRKRNYFGWKLRFKAYKAPYKNGDHWFDIKRNLMNEMNAEAKIWLQSNPQPVIINRYLRNYYVSQDDRIRATIDVCQSMYDQRYKAYPNVVHKANIPNSLVLEFKFNRHDNKYASSILQGLPLRVSRNSKYMTGVKAICGK